MKWYTRRLALALVPTGVCVSVLTTRSGSMSAPFEDCGVWVEGSIDSWPLRFAPALLQALKSFPGKIVHVQHELYGYGNPVNAFTLPLLLALARRFLRKRVVTTVHGVFAPDAIDESFVASNAIRLPLPLVRAAWFGLTAAVCVASDVVQVHEVDQADILTKHYCCPRAKIVVIPIGIEATEIPAASPGSEVLLFFGTISVRKGVIELIQALPDILRARPYCRVILAGGIPARLQSTLDVQQLLLDAKVDLSRVDVRGFVPDEDLRALFAAADVLILPYRIAIAASGPLALALGSGLPVLLSSVFRGSFPEAPLFFEPTSDGIREAVEMFFAVPQARRDLRRFWLGVRAERSWTRVANALKEVYCRLCGI